MAAVIGGLWQEPRRRELHGSRAKLWLPGLITTAGGRDDNLHPDQVFLAALANECKRPVSIASNAHSRATVDAEKFPSSKLTQMAGPGDTETASNAGSDLVDVDSPSDGYFRGRVHPRDVFVPNSSTTAEEEAKAREAVRKRPGNSTAEPASRLSSPASSVRSRTWSVDSSHLLDAGPAPPDYAAATAGRSAAQLAQHFERGTSGDGVDNYAPINYGSFVGPESTSALPPQGRHPADQHDSGLRSNPQSPSVGHGNRGFTNDARLQSMSDAHRRPGGDDEEVGLLSGRSGHPPQRRRGFFRERGWWTKSILGMLAAVIIIFLIAVVLDVANGPESHDHDSKKPNPSGDGENAPENGNGTESVPPPTPTAPPDALHPSDPTCPLEFYHPTEFFEFTDVSRFAFAEAIDPSHYFSGGIRGTIYVRRANLDQGVDVRLAVGVATSRPWRVTDLGYLLDDDGFALGNPYIERVDDSYQGRQCMDIYVSIEVRPDLQIDSWHVATRHLAIQVEDGLFDRGPDRAGSGRLEVAEHTLFKTVAGSLTIPYWRSRETIIETVSGSIHGDFALLDRLFVGSKSGSIKIGVLPEAADRYDPAPAEFECATVSGTVQVAYPLEGKIPDRDYVTYVQTVSSSISGSYLLGSETQFHTKSGTIKATLLPFWQDARDRAKFTTQNLSGSTKLKVLPPYKKVKGAWGTLQHNFDSASGSLDLVYPQEWEGRIDGSTISGSIALSGRDVKIITDRRQRPFDRIIAAQKGHGDGHLVFRSVAGSVSIQAGDV